MKQYKKMTNTQFKLMIDFQSQIGSRDIKVSGNSLYFKLNGSRNMVILWLFFISYNISKIVYVLEYLVYIKDMTMTLVNVGRLNSSSESKYFEKEFMTLIY
jgi:hypothetical protein